MRHLRQIALGALLAVHALAANAGASWQSGHISNFTFIGDAAMIMIDAAVPDNCSGTPAGWLMIPASSRTLKAFVLALWMRGDASSVTVTVYTSGIDGSGFCQVTQIDPS